MTTKMKTKTTAAGFDPAVPLAKIHQHPKNPRRNATASDELVASVKAQGLMQALVLAPHPDIDGEYVLIAGHRRRDALQQVGAKTAKAEIRDDLVTDVQQIEAMLIENSARADLTPIEEAEAYEQLQLFNLKAADIAKAVGRSRATVSSRLKLLNLGAESRTKVHDGQVTIDDALQLVDLDKTAREKVEPLLGTVNFRQALATQQDRKRRTDRFKEDVKVATELGVPAYADGRVDTWALQRDGTVLRQHCRPSDATAITVKNAHAECLRWCRDEDQAGVPVLIFVCSDPDSHVDEHPGQPGTPSTTTDEERAAQAEKEAYYAGLRAQAEREAEERRVAARLRWETMAGADPVAVLRIGLPLFLWSLDSIELGEFNEHLGLEPGHMIYDTAAPYWQQLMLALEKASYDDVLRAVVALVAGELRCRAEDLEENLLVAEAFEGLRKLGHEFGDVDAAQEAAALGHHTDDDPDDDPDDGDDGAEDGAE